MNIFYNICAVINMKMVIENNKIYSKVKSVVMVL